jgi:hypothetical protein
MYSVACLVLSFSSECHVPIPLCHFVYPGVQIRRPQTGLFQHFQFEGEECQYYVLSYPVPSQCRRDYPLPLWSAIWSISHRSNWSTMEEAWGP